MGLHLIGGVLLFKTSFFLFAGYIVFIRRKYQNAALTRQSFSVIHAQLLGFFEKYSVVLPYYLKFSNVVAQLAPVEAKNS